MGVLSLALDCMQHLRTSVPTTRTSHAPDDISGLDTIRKAACLYLGHQTLGDGGAFRACLHHTVNYSCSLTTSSQGNTSTIVHHSPQEQSTSARQSLHCTVGRFLLQGQKLPSAYCKLAVQEDIAHHSIHKAGMCHIKLSLHCWREQCWEDQWGRV